MRAAASILQKLEQDRRPTGQVSKDRLVPPAGERRRPVEGSEDSPKLPGLTTRGTAVGRTWVPGMGRAASRMATAGNEGRHGRLPSRPPKNVDIELISTAKFRGQLPGILRRDVPITYSHSGLAYKMGHSVGVRDSSTSKEPAVLLESGASPCSIVLAYDGGNCKIIHIAQYSKFLHKPPVNTGEVEKTLEINRGRLQELREFILRLSANYRAVVTATNVSRGLQEAVLSDIAAELGVEGARIVEVLLQSEPIPNQPNPKIGITRDQIHTAIYIPGAYTHDLRSKIFIVGDTEDDLRNEENARWLLTEAFKK